MQRNKITSYNSNITLRKTHPALPGYYDGSLGHNVIIPCEKSYTLFSQEKMCLIIQSKNKYILVWFDNKKLLM